MNSSNQKKSRLFGKFTMHSTFKFICWLTVCGVLLSSRLGHTQELFDKSGECGVQLEELRKTDEVRKDIFVIYSKPDLYIAANDDRRIDSRASKLLEMHTRGIVVSESSDRYLFRSRTKLLNDDFICGWISREDVLPFDIEPQKVEAGILWEDPQTGIVEELDNPLAIKAMLKSNPEIENSDAKLVKIYDRPTITSPSRTSASVFGIYFIYAQRGPAHDLWYWIAGEEPKEKTKYAGWVPGSHIMEWESQLSLYFNEKSNSTEIFVDTPSLLKGKKDAVLGQRPKGYKERSTGPADANRKNAGSNIARFPILREEVGVAPSRRGQTLYKVGFFGDSSEVEESSERSRIQEAVKNVDILFVLDNTLSMTEYFPYVVNGVRKSTEIIKSFNDEYQIGVRYGAAVYGDYRDNEASIDNMDFQILSRLGSPGYTDHLGRLTAIAEEGDYFRDALGDKPEAGLAGIVRGITDLEWSTDAQYKVVVWIGDHGSREFGTKESTSLKYIQDLLVSEKVLVFPINVSGRYDPIWNGEFIRQGNELGLNTGLETKIAHDNQQSEDYESAETIISESIGAMYKSSLLASLAIREGAGVDRIISERTDVLDLDIPAAESDIRKISTAICEMAFGSVGCANVKQNKQFMSEGFVKYDALEKNFNFWVNLETVELDVLSRMMRLTCKGFERSSVKRSIEQSMVLITSTLAGDSYRSDIPVGKFLRRYSFLPARHFPSILESTPDAIEELWQQARDLDTENGNNNETRRIADPICKSSALLNLAIDGKRLIDIDKDLVRASELTDGSEESFKWVVADNDRLVDFNWEWSQGGGTDYYYLPVSFFPGSF